MISKTIIIFELYLVVIFLLYRLFYNIKNDIALNKRRKKEYIDSKKRLKPEMRDPILKG